MSILLSPTSEGIEPRTITVSEADMQLMRLDVESHKPEEACGMLIGRIKGFDAITIRTIPVTNTLHSPTRFRMDGNEQLDIFNKMEVEDLELVGIYHSHPLGPAGPSEIDVKEAYYPNVVHLIWSSTEGTWSCSGYSIYGGQILRAVLEFDTHG